MRWSSKRSIHPLISPSRTGYGCAADHSRRFSLLSLQRRPRLGISVRDLRPIDHIAAVRAPELVIGGSDDRHTTEADTRLLYAAAREPKQLWMIPRTAHVDFFDAAGDEYRRRVLGFLDAAIGAKR